MARVERRQFEPVIVTSRELVGQLEALVASSSNGVFAFDGDGTLWSGDVGEDVFHALVTGGLVREAAHPALEREARAHALDASGTPSEIAERLFAAYLAGKYPERDACAMMTWCYAGFRLSELDELTRRVFEQRGLARRLHRELEPVFELALRRSLRIAVVSASPLAIVQRAAAEWGLSADVVAASTPALSGELILDHLHTPVPYAEVKPRALRALFPEHELIAGFGDNVFDIDLFRAARLAVVVRPKPALRARLSELPSAVLLAEMV